MVAQMARTITLLREQVQAEIAQVRQEEEAEIAQVQAEIARVRREEEEANNNARADEIVAAMGGAAPTAEPGEERNDTDEGIAGRSPPPGGDTDAEAIRAFAAREPGLARWARAMIETHPERFDAMPARIRNLLRGFAGVDGAGDSPSDVSSPDDVARLLNHKSKSSPETAPAYTGLELLQLDPFAFLCELYARITRA